jgi:hypothetical protein
MRGRDRGGRAAAAALVVLLAPPARAPTVCSLNRICRGVHNITQLASEFEKALSQNISTGDIPISGTVPTEFGYYRHFIHPPGSFMMQTSYMDRISGTLPTQLGTWTGFSWHMHLVSLEPFLLTKFNNHLSGTFPTELGMESQFPFHVHLTGASLSGYLPTEIGKIAQSETHVHLGYNRMSGTLPTELSQLTQLEDLLELYHNRISGTIGPEVSNLRSLRYLWLAGNQLSGTLPTELGLLARAVDVRLDGNRISGTIPSELAGMQNIAYLNLTLNPLSGTLPPQVAKMAFLPGYITADELHGACDVGPPEQITRWTVRTESANASSDWSSPCEVYHPRWRPPAAGSRALMSIVLTILGLLIVCPLACTAICVGCVMPQYAKVEEEMISGRSEGGAPVHEGVCDGKGRRFAPTCCPAVPLASPQALSSPSS